MQEYSTFWFSKKRRFRLILSHWEHTILQMYRRVTARRA